MTPIAEAILLRLRRCALCGRDITPEQSRAYRGRCKRCDAVPESPETFEEREQRRRPRIRPLGDAAERAQEARWRFGDVSKW